MHIREAAAEFHKKHVEHHKAMTAANETAGQKYHLAMATHHEALAKEHEKAAVHEKMVKYK